MSEAVPAPLSDTQKIRFQPQVGRQCLEVAFQESRLWGSLGHLPRAQGCWSGPAPGRLSSAGDYGAICSNSC